MVQAQCLRNVTTRDIISPELHDHFGRSTLGPKGTQAIIDGAYANNPFLPTSTRQGLKSGKYNTNVDMIIGSNKDDGLEFTAQLYKNVSLLNLYKDRWLDPEINFGAQTLFVVDDFKNIDNFMKERVEKITKFYLGEIEYLNMVNITHFTKMYTDAWYFFAAYDFITKHLPNIGDDDNIYQYHYTHQGEDALSVELNYGGPYGVGHCDETFLQFYPYMNQNISLNRTDSLQSAMLISLWKNFVMTGNPSTDIVEWNPIKSNMDRSYLNIKLSSVMEYSTDVDIRMKFWDQLINTNAGNCFNSMLSLYVLSMILIKYSIHCLNVQTP